MDDDDSIYNALIIALIIGIIIVVITLFLSRPAPETFTELYFNNHLLLPKYVQLGHVYDYSFSVNNLERKPTTYAYNVTEDLYRFDRTCEKPKQYLEPVGQSAYEAYLAGIPQRVPVQLRNVTIQLPPEPPNPQVNVSSVPPPQQIPPTNPPSGQTSPSPVPPPLEQNQVLTRRSESNDPTLLIKNENFSVHFSERTLSGVGQVVASYQSLDNRYSISAIVNENTQKAILAVGLSQSVANISIKPGESHDILLEKSGQNLSMSIDGKQVISQKMNKISPGFISFETTNTFAQINGVSVNDAGTAQSASISFADYTSNDQDLLDDNHPGRYLAANSTNVSDYDYETHFRFRSGNQVKLGIQNAFEIFYNETHLIFNDKTYTLPPSRRNVHSLRVEALHGLVTTWFDDVQIINQSELTQSGGTPFLETMGSDVDVRSISVSSLESPQATRYSVPALEIKLPSNPLPLKAFRINGNNDNNITEIVSDLFNQEQLDWLDYYLTARYSDTFDNGSLSFSFYGKDFPYYQIGINNNKRNATISFVSNGTFENHTFQVAPTGTSEHEFNLDVQGQKVSFIVDNEILINATLDRATNGVMLLNISPDIEFENIIVQDKNNPVVRIFEKKAECTPILIGESKRNESLFLNDNQSVRMNESVSFNQTFDIAKVQVSLDTGQEVHFWVTRT